LSLEGLLGPVAFAENRSRWRRRMRFPVPDVSLPAVCGRDV
jgi:hypothetical protein